MYLNYGILFLRWRKNDLRMKKRNFFLKELSCRRKKTHKIRYMTTSCTRHGRSWTSWNFQKGFCNWTQQIVDQHFQFFFFVIKFIRREENIPSWNCTQNIGILVNDNDDLNENIFSLSKCHSKTSLSLWHSGTGSDRIENLTRWEIVYGIDSIRNLDLNEL